MEPGARGRRRPRQRPRGAADRGRSWSRRPCRARRRRSGAGSASTGDPVGGAAPRRRGLGEVPGRGAGGEGGPALPAPQGMSGWFDSHCHVQEEYLGGGRAGRATGTSPLVLARAAEAGVDRLVCIGTGVTTSAQAVAVARALAPVTTRMPAAWASIGLAPARRDRRGRRRGRAAGTRARTPVTVSWWRWASAAWTTTTSTRRARPNAPPSRRRSRWPTRTGLALVIHARDAWDDLFDMLGRRRRPRADDPALLHRWSRRTGSMRGAPGCSCRSAASSPSRTRRDVRGAAARCPLDRLLVETDSPFLAPVPHRGQRQRTGTVAAGRRHGGRGEGVRRRSRSPPASAAAASPPLPSWPRPAHTAHAARTL